MNLFKKLTECFGFRKKEKTTYYRVEGEHITYYYTRLD